ncbi:diguanylate phosphodiesterase, partial [Clostridioides difficile]|nr:diguanylate phosphodiesterase [Clostridioides difficile]
MKRFLRRIILVLFILLIFISFISIKLIHNVGDYGLVITDCNEYNEDLLLLEKKWEDLNIEIKKVRMKEQNNQLLSISEEFFSLANDTVFKIENFSKEKSNYLMT